MIKNILILALLTWISFSYARKDHPIARDTTSDADSFKIEKPVEQQDAQRSVAGAKIKKKAKNEAAKDEIKNPKESDSELRYWQYSE
jgi:hypothetical protein